MRSFDRSGWSSSRCCEPWASQSASSVAKLKGGGDRKRLRSAAISRAESRCRRASWPKRGGWRRALRCGRSRPSWQRAVIWVPPASPYGAGSVAAMLKGAAYDLCGARAGPPPTRCLQREECAGLTKDDPSEVSSSERNADELEAENARLRRELDRAREREARLGAILESAADYAIFTIDPAGRSRAGTGAGTSSAGRGRGARHGQPPPLHP